MNSSSRTNSSSRSKQSSSSSNTRAEKRKKKKISNKKKNTKAKSPVKQQAPGNTDKSDLRLPKLGSHRSDKWPPGITGNKLRWPAMG